MAFCAKCGAQLNAGSGFCGACGAPVSTQSVTTTSGAAAAPASAPTSTAGSGITDNVAAALSYIWIVGLIFLLIEPYNKNKFLRFHCFQSLFYLLACIVVSIVLGFIPLLGIIVGMLLGLGEFVLWLVLLLKAYQGQKFKLPFIGDLAEQQANAG